MASIAIKGSRWVITKISSGNNLCSYHIVGKSYYPVGVMVTELITGNQMQIRIPHVFGLQRNKFDYIEKSVLLLFISTNDQFIGYFYCLEHRGVC